MLFKRHLSQIIKKRLFKNKVLILYGARQVGKTTLVKNLISEFPKSDYVFFNADEYDIRSAFEEAQSFDHLKSLTGNKKLIVIDEAQRISNIGLKLKILHDNLPDTQIIATGSSSFELANSINEPLTGRSHSFILYPLSFDEISEEHIEQKRHLDSLLKFGAYPEIFLSSQEEKLLNLREITEQYLFKDLLNFSGIKKSETLIKLLKLLAYQIGQVVSNHELGLSLSIDQTTVAKYIELLEKSFVIFRLGSFSNNLRNEVKKSQKIYFYDLGMRNALINDFNELELRPDLGHLWENFCIIERLKHNSYQMQNPSYFFWRNYDKQEVDLIEDWGRSKKLQAFEFKYKAKARFKFPKNFTDSYPSSELHLIDRENFTKKISS